MKVALAALALAVSAHAALPDTASVTLESGVYNMTFGADIEVEAPAVSDVPLSILPQRSCSDEAGTPLVDIPLDTLPGSAAAGGKSKLAYFYRAAQIGDDCAIIKPTGDGESVYSTPVSALGWGETTAVSLLSGADDTPAGSVVLSWEAGSEVITASMNLIQSGSGLLQLKIFDSEDCAALGETTLPAGFAYSTTFEVDESKGDVFIPNTDVSGETTTQLQFGWAEGLAGKAIAIYNDQNELVSCGRSTVVSSVDGYVGVTTEGTGLKVEGEVTAGVAGLPLEIELRLHGKTTDVDYQSSALSCDNIGTVNASPLDAKYTVALNGVDGVYAIDQTVADAQFEDVNNLVYVVSMKGVENNNLLLGCGVINDVKSMDGDNDRTSSPTENAASTTTLSAAAALTIMGAIMYN